MDQSWPPPSAGSGSLSVTAPALVLVVLEIVMVKPAMFPAVTLIWSAVTWSAITGSVRLSGGRFATVNFTP